ncbi:MAG: D-alanine--D-alanine ligase, partial [Spirochaetaceae bacterium]|nr:D-alanine--D-alanine ligase [Spirochaetaceae bacterium]
MLNVAILYGGRSGEHEVSCTSGAAVLKNLNPGHDVTLIGISREGTWYLQKRPEPLPEVLPINTPGEGKVSILPGEGLA